MDLAQLENWFLLAQDDQGLPFIVQIFPFILIGLLFWFMMIRPERQKQKAMKELLANVKKSDRVVTVGGIKGVVVNVNRDADEVVLNIDESTGAKIRVTVSSISRVETGSVKEPDGKKDN